MSSVPFHVVQAAHVGRQHFRQLVDVLLFEASYPGLELGHLDPDFFQFAFQKGGGFLGLLFAHLKIFRQIQRGKYVGYLLDFGRFFAFIGEGEGNGGRGRPAGATIDDFRAHRFEQGVLFHFCHDFLGGLFVFQVRVKAEAIDNLHQTRKAHDALVELLHTLLGIARHRCHDKILGDLLLLD